MAIRTTRTDHSIKFILLVVMVAVSTILASCGGPAEAVTQPTQTTGNEPTTTPFPEVTEESIQIPMASVKFIKSMRDNFPSMFFDSFVSKSDQYAKEHGLTFVKLVTQIKSEDKTDPNNVKKIELLISKIISPTFNSSSELSILAYLDKEGNIQFTPIIEELLETRNEGNQSMVARVIKEEAREKFLSTGELDLNSDLGQIVYAINFGDGLLKDQVLDKINQAPDLEAAKQIITDTIHSIVVIDPNNAENQVAISFPLATREVEQVGSERLKATIEQVANFLGFGQSVNEDEKAEFPSDEVLLGVIEPYAAAMGLTASQIFAEIKENNSLKAYSVIEGRSIEIIVHNDTPLLKRKEGEWSKITLKDLVEGKSINIGVSLLGGLSHDLIAKEIIKQEFNQITIEGFHWKFLEPEKGRNDFNYTIWTNGLVREWLDLNLTAHPLFFPANNPEWLASVVKTDEDAKAIIKKHVSETISRHPEFGVWIVLNEPYLTTPTYNYTRPDVLYNILGDEAYVLAFKEARKYAPSAILILNDTLNHASKGKNSMTAARTKELLQKIETVEGTEGTRLVDGIGLQMHIDATDIPSEKDLIETMKGYGRPIYLTEIDVDISNIGGDQQQRFNKQAEIYELIIRSALKSGVLKNITFWGIGDKYSWLELFKNKPNADATLFDDTLKPKASYYSVSKTIYLELLQ